MSALIETKEKLESKADSVELNKLKREVFLILVKPESLSEFKEYLIKHARHPLFKDILEFALFEAIEKNKLEEVEHLRSSYRNITFDDCKEKKEGNTPMIHACGYGTVEMVKLLQNHLYCSNFCYKSCNHSNYNAFTFAISRKRKEIVSYLKSLEVKTVYDMSILKQTLYTYQDSHYHEFIKAILEGDDMEMLEYLYKHHSKEIAKLPTPIIFIAVEKGSINGIDCILKHEPNSLNLVNDCCTPFGAAADQGNVPVMEFLFNRNPEVIKKKNGASSPICLAAESGCWEAFEFILKHDKEAFNDKFWSFSNPLLSAAKSGSHPILEFLLSPQSPIKKQQMECIGLCVWFAADNGHFNAVKYLLSQGGKIPYDTKQGKQVYAPSLFQTSSDSGKYKAIREYIEQVKNIFNSTKLGELSKIKAWVENGNTINFTDEHHDSLLHIAMEYNQKDVALYLLEQGISKETLNAKNETPFSKALRLGNIKLLVDIFKNRADKINETSEDEKIAAEKIRELQNEFETLIQNAEGLKIQIDYEALGVEYHKKYWLKFADEVVKLNKYQDPQKKEKLGELIYGGHILCKENDKGELSFEVPEASRSASEGGLHSSEGIETKDIEESDEARHLRLKWALRFAIEGHNYASAMRILMETTLEKTSFGDIIKPSQSAAAIKSPEDFIMLFMDLNYRPKSKVVPKVEAPEVDKPEGVKPKSVASIQGLD